MRTFVGIDLEHGWRDAVSAGCAGARDLAPMWRDQNWVPPENLHVTLKFFGDLPDDAADTLAADLTEALAGVRGFSLPLARFFEAMPNDRQTRMLWVALEDADGLAGDLAARVAAVSELYGVLPDTRDFRAHITLCRAKRPRSFKVAEEASSIVLGRASALGLDPVMSVPAVTVFRSTLTKQGAEYDRLCVIPLVD